MKSRFFRNAEVFLDVTGIVSIWSDPALATGSVKIAFHNSTAVYVSYETAQAVIEQKLAHEEAVDRRFEAQVLGRPWVQEDES